ncbi:hypothetical protein C5B96_15830 [Subtercola sp. Z020]|uniref:hypothetical protein n=1 Tax=Subtercola sp. Z020 TaxID=2080582 RepID=UPI000CE87613|nr:hypothetical protein [Subtercola sp. Z020]PPF77340.1 hypothetical protein C5B96_15830 [Subtercola sp. Z020]
MPFPLTRSIRRFALWARRVGVTVFVAAALIVGPASAPAALAATATATASGEVPDSASTSLVALVITAVAAFIVGASALIVRRHQKEPPGSEGDRQ